MEISVQVGKLEGLKAEAVYCPVFEGAKIEPDFAAFDKATGGAIAQILKSGDFSGKVGQMAVAYPNGSVKRAEGSCRTGVNTHSWPALHLPNAFESADRRRHSCYTPSVACSGGDAA